MLKSSRRLRVLMRNEATRSTIGFLSEVALHPDLSMRGGVRLFDGKDGHPIMARNFAESGHLDTGTQYAIEAACQAITNATRGGLVNREWMLSELTSLLEEVLLQSASPKA